MQFTLLVKNKAFTTSVRLAKGVEIEHRSVVSLINKYFDVGSLCTTKGRAVEGRGKKIDIFFLNEEQATLLISLMKNTKIVVDFKKLLVSEFFKQRALISQILANKTDEQWRESRLTGKETRKDSTDVIQKFVRYAINQGSKSAEKYYMSISRMELTGLFILDQQYPNHRDVMTIRQLDLVKVADEVISVALNTAMEKGLPYKECYKYARDRIHDLSKLIPKSPIVDLLSVSACNQPIVLDTKTNK